MASSRIEGLSALIANIREAGLSVRHESVPATAAGASVIRKQAKVNAKAQGLEKSGALIRNIAIKRDKNAKYGQVQYNIGVRHGRHAFKTERIARKTSGGKIVYQYVNDPFYWPFWERGHYNVRTKRYEKKPFIAPAIEGKKDEAVEAMRAKLKARLDKFIAKSNARAGR